MCRPDKSLRCETGAQRLAGPGREPRAPAPWRPAQTFLGTVEGKPVLVAPDGVTNDDGSHGWLLLSLELDALQRRHIAPKHARRGCCGNVV